MIASFVVDTKIGVIEVVYQNDQISRIILDCKKSINPELNPFEEMIPAQLESYFGDASYQLTLPIDLIGTKHQKAVWTKMLEIPCGSVMTYGDIAKLIGSSGQAVGNACRNNPIPIIVPCHRVVAANAIGGFSGATEGALVKIKQVLLAHEGVHY
jgi:methylated-DNA-[protein]-cysteine S-methyltransferase